MEAWFRSLIKTINKIHLNLGIKKFLSRNFRINFYSKGPVFFRINPVDYRCNHNCIMCWRKTIKGKTKTERLEKEKNSLALFEYKKLFKELPLSTYTINVTGGGEPLLHPQIWQILRLIKKHCFYGYLMTNGALLTKERVKQLLDMKWDLIRFSFHASNKQTYCKIHGKNDFGRVIKIIKFLKSSHEQFSEHSIKISLLFVIQKLNFREIKRFVALAQKLAVDEIEFDNLMPVVSNTLLEKNQIKSVIKDLQRVVQFSTIPNNALAVIRRYKTLYQNNHSIKKNGVTLSKKRFIGKKCPYVSDSVFINSYGDVQACCLLSNKIGNIREKAFSKIWTSKLYKKVRWNLNRGLFYPDCFKKCSFELMDKK